MNFFWLCKKDQRFLCNGLWFWPFLKCLLIVTCLVLKAYDLSSLLLLVHKVRLENILCLSIRFRSTIKAFYFGFAGPLDRQKKISRAYLLAQTRQLFILLSIYLLWTCSFRWWSIIEKKHTCVLSDRQKNWFFQHCRQTLSLIRIWVHRHTRLK